MPLAEEKKIVFNTGIIYTRVVIRLILGLFTTRLVLDALGETDYGIYVLVAGLLGMLEFVNISVTNSSMRFIANSIGSGDEIKINKSINTAFIVHLILGLIVVFCMEMTGWILFENILNIPADRVSDAKIVFHFMVITTFISLLNVPFGSIVTAHENFLVVSIIDITISILKLAIAVYIFYLPSNQLVIYGLLISINQLLRRIVLQLYIRTKYRIFKINLNKFVDKTLIREMLSFVGWSILGTFSWSLTVHLRSVLINMFFGVRLNAANGVSATLTGQLGVVSESLTQAIQPQIMKSEGGGGREKMLRLTQVAAKFSVFLLAIFSIPVFIEAPYLLKLWLQEVPEFTVVFCRLMIINMIIERYTFPITTALQSVGNIKMITFVTLIISVLGIPAIFYLFNRGMPPQTIYLVGIGVSLVKTVARLHIGKRVAGINIRSYLNYVFFRGTLPLFLGIAFAPVPFLTMDEGFLRLVFTVIVSMSASLIFIKYYGLTAEENQKINVLIRTGFYKIRTSLIR